MNGTATRAVFAVALLVACSDRGSGTSESGVAVSTAAPVTLVAPTGFPSDPVKDVSRTVVIDGLQNPWDIAFAPEGHMLFTERARGLSVRLTDGTRRLLYAPPDLLAEQQSGALGIALDKNFATNRTLYLYLSSNAGARPDNRIVALRIDPAWTAVTERRDLVTGITYAGGTHSGGRLRIGPDDLLYATTGDTHQGHVPQHLRELGGKVLRVDLDGNAASGNTPRLGSDPRIFAFGFRNPQGLAFRPGTPNAFIAEHGPGYSDEVTALRAGGNGGWDPLCADGIRYCGYNGSTPMTDQVKFPGAINSTWNNGRESEGLAGAAFLEGAQWGDWNGALVVAFLAGRRLEILRLDASGTSATNASILGTLNVRLRAVTLGPDGALYVSTDKHAGGDEIWRLLPQ